ncbi:hypothetical protein [Natronolimnohabitans innermongolicus]|uniref:hypothetical protein n=1 Tax=Natronolimnohabitans innermongolicus TaxID=253107 RepID=UPI000A4DD7FE|nr:hypothetical protein [Natronolimnohabitans innermongolicus]
MISVDIAAARGDQGVPAGTDATLRLTDGTTDRLEYSASVPESLADDTVAL